MATTTPAGVRGGHAKHGGGHGPSNGAPMTHRHIMEALSGLLLGMFVAILSSTIVSNALPEIIHDLEGGQSAYTWVVTASLLAMTASTPLWGKLSDLFSKKLLVQVALIIYVAGSVVAGLSQNTGMLIACRVVQGIGVGGLSALAQIVMAAMISPRERGRYSGYLGAVFAVATVGGPLLGGVITDTSWLGWRWCFYVGVPFAVIALIVLQKTLKLPVVRREGVRVDWAGAFFITAAVSLLLVWVTLAGDKYDWLSWQTLAMVGGAVLLGAVFVLVEAKAKEPIIPLRLFRNPTITLASAASLFVGIAMFTGTVFFSQYFQLARDKSPTMSGIMTIPMIGGLFVSSTVSGQIITKTGRWKAWLVSGGALLTAGLGLLGTIRYDTEYWHIAIFMALMGLGIGMMMQNLVLATQNQVAPEDLGSASSVVTFFRSLGGAVGVSALGAVLANRVTHYVKDGLAELGPRAAQAAAHGGGTSGGGIPDLDALPAPLRTVMESAYGHGVGDVFLYAAPCALLAFLLTLFIKEVALKTRGGLAQSSEQGAAQGSVQGNAENAGPGAPAAHEAYGEREPALVGATAVSDHSDPEPYGDEGTKGTKTPPSWAQPARLPSQSLQAYASADTGNGTPPDPSGPSVHGFVRNADGNPVPRSAVTLISLSGRQLARVVAQANGSYALTAPGAGSYVLIAAADGHQPQAATVVVGDQPHSYDILLSGTSGLAGQVRSAAAGEPVDGAMVVVTDVRGEVLATGKTSAEGYFAFDELAPGTFTLAVNAAHHRPAALPIEVGGQGTTHIEVELLSGARVQGTVRAGGRDGSPQPLADARVTLVDAAGNVVATSTTGEDGAYAFTDLDAGDYTVIASGYPPVATGLAVDASGVDAHDIDLAHPGD
ncbi:major facilitator superfamily transporter [Streptomyces sp. NBRC 110611]|uniref:MFS transporter n=1 Tax=Streptomyces sp. NBRC 110611 TaxID=1621259 RepID=UPI0008338149|nr:MFS transporter [Streptomyces sp. NBRC 110611]GAU66896.1 major facilitator superfamily transporter [Streptomyces sp. NBRC 110611]